PRAVETNAGVTVARASAMLARCLAAALGHFMSAYALACSYQVGELSALSSFAGSPVSSSNCSRLRRAVMSSERRPSAWALSLKLFECEREPTRHRNSKGFGRPFRVRIDQMTTSYVSMSPHTERAR